MPVRLNAEAEAEFEEAIAYYESQRQGLGKRFKAAVLSTCRSIGENPRHRRKVLGDVRAWAVPGFRYNLYYFEVDSWIDVISVFHQSRDPRVWQERI